MKGGRAPRNVLVAGAGAVGQFLGARLQQGGHLVTLLARAVHADAIRADGLRVKGHSDLHGHVDCITEPAQARNRYDAIVVTAKAYATADVAAQVATLLDADGIVLSLQNGFGNGAKLAATFDPARVALAITSHGVMVERPGVVVHAGAGTTAVGPFVASVAGAGPVGGTFAGTAGLAHALLSDAGLEPELHADMRPHVWRKALVNHAVNPVAAVRGAANGDLLAGKAWQEVAELAEEGYAVARAAGVALPDIASPAAMAQAVRGTLSRTAGNRNSMVQDVANRRPTEIEQISGRLVRLARRLGHPAFASETAYHRLKDLEAGYMGGVESLRRTRDEAAWEAAPF